MTINEKYHDLFCNFLKRLEVINQEPDGWCENIFGLIFCHIFFRQKLFLFLCVSYCAKFNRVWECGNISLWGRLYFELEIWDVSFPKFEKSHGCKMTLWVYLFKSKSYYIYISWNHLFYRPHFLSQLTINKFLYLDIHPMWYSNLQIYSCSSSEEWENCGC